MYRARNELTESYAHAGKIVAGCCTQLMQCHLKQRVGFIASSNLNLPHFLHLLKIEFVSVAFTSAEDPLDLTHHTVGRSSIAQRPVFEKVKGPQPASAS